MSNPSLVSVCIITYNHYPFIRQAIESVLMQKTSFAWEVVIADDYSTDGTREIVLDYQRKYPDKIRLILQEKNVGAANNWIDLMLYPKSKYIAYLEGDDYWSADNKLNNAIVALEEDESIGMICTDYAKLHRGNILEYSCLNKSYIKNGKILLDEYILDRSSISTATIVFKNDLFNSYVAEVSIERILSWNVGDVAFILYILHKSTIKVLDEISAVYRINISSASKITKEDIRYSYYLKGFEIPFYFVSWNKISTSAIDKLNYKFNLQKLRYRLVNKDSRIYPEALDEMRNYGRLSIKHYMMYYLAEYRIARMIFIDFKSFLLKIKIFPKFIFSAFLSKKIT